MEPKEVYEAYNTGKFGQGCLLARRLIEAGSRFVEVTTDYTPFDGWDTHSDGHRRTIELKKQIDRPIARLIKDLEERGLLDRTLVIVASEFSRDSLVEGNSDRLLKTDIPVPDIISNVKHFGLHRHFSGAGSVLLFGGGIRQGAAYGKTAEVRPCKVIESPVQLIDLHASLLTALGIPPDYSAMINERPFYVTKDGLGKSVGGLFT